MNIRVPQLKSLNSSLSIIIWKLIDLSCSFVSISLSIISLIDCYSAFLVQVPQLLAQYSLIPLITLLPPKPTSHTTPHSPSLSVTHSPNSLHHSPQNSTQLIHMLIIIFNNSPYFIASPLPHYPPVTSIVFVAICVSYSCVNLSSPLVHKHAPNLSTFTLAAFSPLSLSHSLSLYLLYRVFKIQKKK